MASVWSLFAEERARAAVLDAYVPGESLLARARGWAVLFGVVLLDAGRINDPRNAAAGARLLRRLDVDA